MIGNWVDDLVSFLCSCRRSGDAEVNFSGFGVGGDGGVLGIHESGKSFADDGFGYSDDAQGAAVERFSDVDLVEDCFDGASEHRAEFIFRAGQGKDVVIIFRRVKSGRSSVGIGNWGSGGWTFGLSKLGFGHFESALAIFFDELIFY